MEVEHQIAKLLVEVSYQMPLVMEADAVGFQITR
jgi:hypothetical protein